MSIVFKLKNERNYYIVLFSKIFLTVVTTVTCHYQHNSKLIQLVTVIVAEGFQY